MKVQQLSEDRNNSELNLSNSNQELASLRATLSSMEQKALHATESARKAEEGRQAEVTSLQEKLQNELDSLNQQMVATREHYEGKLAEAKTAISLEVEKAAKLEIGAQSLRDALETLKREHAAELSLSKSDHSQAVG